jgi:hypothetical protein
LQLFYFHLLGFLFACIAVHTKFLPVLLVFSLGVIPALLGQPESVLHLEPPSRGNPPFRQGEQLEVQGNPNVSAGVMRITIVDISHWPWVLASSERGRAWLNFDHMVMVKTVAAE